MNLENTSFDQPKKSMNNEYLLEYFIHKLLFPFTIQKKKRFWKGNINKPIKNVLYKK